MGLLTAEEAKKKVKEYEGSSTIEPSYFYKKNQMDSQGIQNIEIFFIFISGVFIIGLVFTWFLLRKRKLQRLKG